MKTCPACRKQIDRRATKCPYCQTAFSAADMASGASEFRRRYALKLALIVAGLVAAFIWLNSGGAEQMGTWF